MKLLVAVAVGYVAFAFAKKLPQGGIEGVSAGWCGIVSGVIVYKAIT